jgi:hypothetical protein
MRPLLTLVLTGCLVLPPAALHASGPLARAVADRASWLSLANAQAGPVPPPDGVVELRWAELATVVAGRRVTAVLSDGARVSGDALIVRDDALVLDVDRSTGSRAYPGGNAPISRVSIVLLEVEKQGGAGRPLGIVLGVLTGVVIGAWVSGEVADSAGAGIPIFLGVASGITFAGYHAGKVLSRQVTVIRIVDAPGVTGGHEQ